MLHGRKWGFWPHPVLEAALDASKPLPCSNLSSANAAPCLAPRAHGRCTLSFTLPEKELKVLHSGEDGFDLVHNALVAIEGDKETRLKAGNPAPSIEQAE